jgi:hypothetical protein
VGVANDENYRKVSAMPGVEDSTLRSKNTEGDVEACVLSIRASERETAMSSAIFCLGFIVGSLLGYSLGYNDGKLFAKEICLWERFDRIIKQIKKNSN